MSEMGSFCESLWLFCCLVKILSWGGLSFCLHDAHLTFGVAAFLLDFLGLCILSFTKESEARRLNVIQTFIKAGVGRMMSPRGLLQS